MISLDGWPFFIVLLLAAVGFAFLPHVAGHALGVW